MSPRTQFAHVAMRTRALLRDWWSDEGGQDLIEYAMLATFIAIVGLLGMQAIEDSMGSTYLSWDQPTQDAWEVADPIPEP